MSARLSIEQAMEIAHQWRKAAECRRTAHEMAAAQGTSHALDLFDQAINYAPYCAPLFLERGAIRLIESQLRDGMQDLSRAYNIDLHSLPALFTTGRPAFLYEGYTKLRDHLDAALEALPNAAENYYHRALLAAIEGASGNAEFLFGAAIERDRTEARYPFARGLMRLEREQYAQAREDFQQTLVQNPKHAAAYRDAGWTLFFLGDPEQALECLNTSIGLVANHPRSYFQRGVVYEVLENPRAALTDYQQSLQLGGMDLDAAGRALALANESGRAVDFERLQQVRTILAEALDELRMTVREEQAAGEGEPVVIDVQPHETVNVVLVPEPVPAVATPVAPTPIVERPAHIVPTAITSRPVVMATPVETTVPSERPSLFGTPGAQLSGLGTLGSQRSAPVTVPPHTHAGQLAHVPLRDALTWCEVAEEALRGKRIEEALQAIAEAIALDEQVGKFYWVRARILEAKGERFQSIADDQRAASRGFAGAL